MKQTASSVRAQAVLRELYEQPLAVAPRSTPRSSAEAGQGQQRAIRANCAVDTVLADAEQEHMNAPSAVTARRATARGLERCSDCPLWAGCRDWASAEKYTGLAGGDVWSNGVPMGRKHVLRNRLPDGHQLASVR